MPNPAQIAYHPVILGPEFRRLETFDVVPLSVFAAGKNEFEAIVIGVTNTSYAKDVLFKKMRLAAHGWERGKTNVSHVGNKPQGMVFRVRRL